MYPALFLIHMQKKHPHKHLFEVIWHRFAWKIRHLSRVPLRYHLIQMRVLFVRSFWITNVTGTLGSYHGNVRSWMPLEKIKLPDSNILTEFSMSRTSDFIKRQEFGTRCIHSVDCLVIPMYGFFDRYDGKVLIELSDLLNLLVDQYELLSNQQHCLFHKIVYRHLSSSVSRHPWQICSYRIEVCHQRK